MSARTSTAAAEKLSLLLPHDPPALFLRTCDADMKAYGGFEWPTSGTVTAPDWREDDNCGHGLHGLLWGEGDAGHLSWSDDAKWMVFAASSSIDLEGKHKVETAEVRVVGDRRMVTDYLIANGAKGKVHGATVTAGHRGTATAGHRGTATAGDRGTATAGDSGTATAGDRGTATAGDSGTATAGDSGTVVVKYYDYAKERYRMVVGYVGEDGIEAGVAYRVVDRKLVAVSK